MPKQIPKQCRWCEYTAGNGGALSSHAKTKHPGEWDAFKAQQAQAPAAERPSLSSTPTPDAKEPEPMAGFRLGVFFRVEVAEEDTAAWQPMADRILDLFRQAVAMADLPANVEVLQSGRGAMLPARALEAPRP